MFANFRNAFVASPTDHLSKLLTKDSPVLHNLETNVSRLVLDCEVMCFYELLARKRSKAVVRTSDPTHRVRISASVDTSFTRLYQENPRCCAGRGTLACTRTIRG